MRRRLRQPARSLHTVVKSHWGSCFWERELRSIPFLESHWWGISRESEIAACRGGNVLALRSPSHIGDVSGAAESQQAVEHGGWKIPSGPTCLLPSGEVSGVHKSQRDVEPRGYCDVLWSAYRVVWCSMVLSCVVSCCVLCVCVCKCLCAV